MLENINKKNYIRMPYRVDEQTRSSIETWILNFPTGFSKWCSPFGDLECESQVSGDYTLEDVDYDDPIDCELVAAFWRKDAPFYKGEIWRNDPDIVFEYQEIEDQFGEIPHGWRAMFHKDFLVRSGNEWIRQEIFRSKLRTEIDLGLDGYVKLSKIRWGCP